MKIARLLVVMVTLTFSVGGANVGVVGNNFGSGDCVDFWCRECRWGVQNCTVCWDGYYWRSDCSPCGRMC